VKFERVFAPVVTTKLTFATFVVDRFQTYRFPSLGNGVNQIVTSVCVCTLVLFLHAYLTAACSTIELSRNMDLKEHCDSRMLIPSQRCCDGRNPAVVLRDSTIESRPKTTGLRVVYRRHSAIAEYVLERTLRQPHVEGRHRKRRTEISRFWIPLTCGIPESGTVRFWDGTSCRLSTTLSYRGI
jgi:hypothetical protein